MSPPRTLQQRIAARALTALGVGALTALLVLSGLTARAEAWIGDAFLRLATPKANPDIVVVAIDPASLGEIGAWPWSRRVHARLLDRLTQAGARGVALDLLLTEPALYDPVGDALLAKALERNGRTVLPVLAEAADAGGRAVELTPITEFAAAAAALGHADPARDRDGVSRGMFLHAGLGAPRWPSLSLALSDMRRPGQLPADDVPDFVAATESPQGWQGDRYVLVPFVRPANGFRRFSYADVLEGRVADAELHNRRVLVGIDADGMGETVTVPGGDARIAGVYYHANALNALLGGHTVAPLGTVARIVLSALLAALPLALLGLPGLGRMWKPMAIAAAATLLLSLSLLLLANTWFPPLTALLVLSLGTLLWRRRGRRQARRIAQTDTLTGLANRPRFESALERELQAMQHNGMPLSILLVDADYFRQFVARFGNAIGDQALRTLAGTLRNRARRPRDLVARTGPGQFAVLLPETSAYAAAAIATTLHVDLASLPGKPEAGLPDDARLTVSIGIHTVPDAGAADAETAFSRAETALYQAKQLGRNRSFTYTGNTAGEGGEPAAP